MENYGYTTHEYDNTNMIGNKCRTYQLRDNGIINDCGIITEDTVIFIQRKQSGSLSPWFNGKMYVYFIEK